MAASSVLVREIRIYLAERVRTTVETDGWTIGAKVRRYFRVYRPMYIRTMSYQRAGPKAVSRVRVNTVPILRKRSVVVELANKLSLCSIKYKRERERGGGSR